MTVQSELALESARLAWIAAALIAAADIRYADCTPALRDQIRMIAADALRRARAAHETDGRRGATAFRLDNGHGLQSMHGR